VQLHILVCLLAVIFAALSWSDGVSFDQLVHLLLFVFPAYAPVVTMLDGILSDIS
jgi:hypothetical protein